jgi:hypothetical protein
VRLASPAPAARSPASSQAAPLEPLTSVDSRTGPARSTDDTVLRRPLQNLPPRTAAKADQRPGSRDAHRRTRDRSGPSPDRAARPRPLRCRRPRGATDLANGAHPALPGELGAVDDRRPRSCRGEGDDCSCLVVGASSHGGSFASVPAAPVGCRDGFRRRRSAPRRGHRDLLRRSPGQLSGPIPRLCPRRRLRRRGLQRWGGRCRTDEYRRRLSVPGPSPGSGRRSARIRARSVSGPAPLLSDPAARAAETGLALRWAAPSGAPAALRPRRWTPGRAR